MPALGKGYKTGKRDLVIDKQFCNDLRAATGLDIDDKLIREIILDSNKEISNLVINSEDGFKLPENMGYIVVTKYKSKKRAIDWVNSKRLKKKIFLPNLHSFGYTHHIHWFKKGLTQFAFKDVYKLVPSRLLSRGVAKSVKDGKLYDTWTSSDFWNKSKTLRKIYTKN